jgi:hypothetical protein
VSTAIESDAVSPRRLPAASTTDAGVLDWMLVALGRPAWAATAADVDRQLASASRATSRRRSYLQAFRGFHWLLAARKAAKGEAALGVRLACPADGFNIARHVSDSPAPRQPHRQHGLALRPRHVDRWPAPRLICRRGSRSGLI